MKKTLLNILCCLFCSVLWAQEPVVNADSTRAIPDTTQNIIAPSPIETNTPNTITKDTTITSTPAISTPIENPVPITQNTAAPKKQENTNKLTTRFAKDIVEFGKGELISNVLIVTNNLPTEQKFYVNFTIPSSWGVIAQSNELYDLLPGDSLIIPFHALPREKFKGNTRFMFYAFISDDRGNNMGTHYFYGLIKKNIRWNVTVSDNKIYIPNHTSSVPFSVGVINECTDEQDIHLTANALKKNVLIKDSSNTYEIKFPLTFTLKAFADTEWHFTFNKYKEPRNYRLTDVEEYKPYSLGESKRYKLTINSFSPEPGENKKYRAGNKIDFLELSDSWQINPYNSMVIPLVVDANIYNLVGAQPMMTVDLRGEMMFNDSSVLIYQTQFAYTSSLFSTNPYENAVYNLGYYARKFNVQFGQVNSGLLGTYQTGKGIKGEYYINRNHKIGAFYVASPELFKFMPILYSFGLNHSYENKILKINTVLGRNVNQQQNTNTDVITTNLSLKIIKNHSFGIRLGGSHYVQTDSNYTRYGYMAGIYYSGAPVKNIWRMNINGMYTAPHFGVFSNERFTANMGNTVTIHKTWNINEQSNFYRYPQKENNILYNNYILNNVLNINHTNAKKNLLTPLVFYNVYSLSDFMVHSRGLGINVSNYQLDKNIRYFFNIRSGFNRAIDTLHNDYFFTQAALYVQVHTFSVMFRYQLGNQSYSKESFFNNSIKNPQTIGISTRYQYRFKNPSFIYQQLLSYTYSTFTGNQFNFTPELLYYTKSGWRFRVYNEINFSKHNQNSLPESYYYMNNVETETPHWNYNYYLGLGIRKEFGIPVPFVKPINSTLTFTAFYDINGNGKRDANETYLENVVILINGWEVITNEKGEAMMENIPNGKYGISSFSVVDLKGWFPNISDTIIINKTSDVAIPFVRGVKITGKVFIQRDPNSPTADFKLDVSRIKISIANHKSYTTLTDKNGYYELYVPAGNYVLSMDESILGSRLQLMQNNFELNIDEKFNNLFIPFYIVEKPRKIKVIRFDNNGNKIDE